MLTDSKLTRRQILLGSGNIIAAGSLMALFPALEASAAAKPITVGFIYVGPRNDYGWNQAHAVGAKKIARLEGVKLIEQENVPETVEVEKVMEGMIRQDGAKVVFPTSFGYWPHILKLARNYPDVLFVHIGALWKEGDPKNTIGYRGYMEEPHYLCGVAAGHMTKTGKVGFIGSKPLYFIFNNLNGFILGARSVNPNITCQVVITGDWNNPVREAEVTNSLIDQGVDVMVANVDSAKVVIENSERRGIYSCGYHTDLSELAPKGFLTGAEWNWAAGAAFVKAWQTGGQYPNLLRGGFRQDMVAISPFGKVVPEDVRAKVLKIRQGFMDDTFKLYKGPLRDNEGNVILKDGQVIANDDNKFKLGVNFLVEGAIGKTGLKK
ncbi:MAG: BMP family ABC transporter substrate-binding protein [Candidatus Rokubacteria bacterium]|nr:BMP family ABC transporter substrate-binding protein [Candidatus Rokubacteria bacterium]